mmetsp:Transcript_39224/g.34917  ORF Transcript_39224/g.34917 Transcript_39224/m.34917 type:complete len:124 (+) Transcript_39224:2503-2874(+)
MSMPKSRGMAKNRSKPSASSRKKVEEVEEKQEKEEEQMPVKVKPSFSKDSLTEVVKKQAVNGQWELDDAVATKMGQNLKNLLAAKPSDISSDAAWFTLLVLVWIESCFEESYSTWQLVHGKGV